jgi:uncharacterized delta-60 repeat protein
MDWEKRYDHGLTGHDSARAIGLDPNGNLFVAGSSLGLNATWTYEIVTLKYSRTGALLWERRYDSAGSGFDDTAVDVEAAPDGSVIVLGQGPGSSGDQDIVLIRYDAAGAQQWVRRWSNWWSDGATGLELAPDGSIYVLGGTYYAGNVSDILLLKYDALGTLLWQRNYHGGIGTDVGSDLDLDSQGNVVVGGYSISPAGTNNFDWVALKYDPAGNLLWSARRGGTFLWPDYCWGMCVDSNDDVLMTGYLVNTSGNQDFTTMKLGGDGNWLWQRELGTATGGGSVVTSDRARNVYVAGQSRVLSYDAAGNLRWSRSLTVSPASSASATGIALDTDEHLIVAGSAWVPGSSTQFLVEAFRTNGVFLSALTHGGTQGEGPAARALATRGRWVYVTGASPNTHDNDALTIRCTLVP